MVRFGQSVSAWGDRLVINGGGQTLWHEFIVATTISGMEHGAQ